MLNEILKSIHPNWISLLHTPYKDGLLIDEFTKAITTISKLKCKLVPDHPLKVLKCLTLDPTLIKCVIIGQDPYPQPGVATGYAFGCEGKLQPSLEIIVREMMDECGIFALEDTNFKSDLSNWTEQGVLLLNASLTCEQWKPNSHTEIWHDFVQGLIDIIDGFIVNNQPVIFVQVGKEAQKFNIQFNTTIKKNHPAAEKHGSIKFTGWFNEVNEHLEKSGLKKIEWAELKIKEIDWKD